MGGMEDDKPGILFFIWNMMTGRAKTFNASPGGIRAKGVQVEPSSPHAGLHEQIPDLILIVIPAKALDPQGILIEIEPFSGKEPLKGGYKITV